MASEIEAEYRRRHATLEGEYAIVSTRSQSLLAGVVSTAGSLVYLVYRLVHGSGKVWQLLIPLAALAVLLPLWGRARRASLRAMRLLDWYERGLGRVDGSAIQSGNTGEAFQESGHLYARDLDVLGPDSLFGMLATTRTAVGQRTLARMLLHGVEAVVARGRQDAVRELAPLLDLRERVALLGWSSFQEVPAESFEKWLTGPRGEFAIWMRWVLIAMTLSWVVLTAVTLIQHGDVIELTRHVAALLAVQGAFCLWLRPRVAIELEASQHLAGQMAILRDGLRTLRMEQFEAAGLRDLQRRVEGEDQALRDLARSLMLVEQRAKEWYYAPALLLAVGTHAAISLSVWRTNHDEAMRTWLTAWAEFDALLAVSTYAAEHPEHVYPKIVDNGPVFAAEGLAHPLLDSADAVANDVRLDAETRFLLISGSNMAGKSTLLRSVGCNVVLTLLGAPVCARGLTTSALCIGASLALVDSLAEGKSKFLTEVERLRDLVGLARAQDSSVLFLIDEIFSGTNSADRRVAAAAVLRGLIGAGAVGALSTHDLALAELAEIFELHGRNVHMASADESDPLGFDYLLKPGVNRTTNALAIVRMLGLT